MANAKQRTMVDVMTCLDHESAVAAQPLVVSARQRLYLQNKFT